MLQSLWIVFFYIQIDFLTRCCCLPGTVQVGDVLLVQGFWKLQEELRSDGSCFCHLYILLYVLQHSLGTVSVCRDKLIMKARGFANTDEASFNGPGGMLSIRAAFLLFKLFSSFSTKTVDTYVKTNTVFVSIWPVLVYPQTKSFKGTAADFMFIATLEKNLQNEFASESFSVFDADVVNWFFFRWKYVFDSFPKL